MSTFVVLTQITNDPALPTRSVRVNLDDVSLYYYSEVHKATIIRLRSLKNEGDSVAVTEKPEAIDAQALNPNNRRKVEDGI